MILIPKPSQTTLLDGYFHLTGDTVLFLDSMCNDRDFEAARILKKEIGRCTCITPKITKGFSIRQKNRIILRKESIEESYRLAIDPQHIEIVGCDSKGLSYGIQTLRQLIRINAAKIPCMMMNDSPAFKNRGFYHDITRGKIPRLDTLMELADRLSFYKLDQLQLYIEHSFAFSKQSEIWVDSDPITAEEILILDEYCQKRNIELVPSLSTFGHLYHILVSETYKHLNEISELKDGPFLWPNRQNHYTLDASNPESIEFVCGMIDEFLPLFTSDKFNICCDETFDLGMDKNKELAQKIGKDRLYMDFVGKIISHVKSYNKKVMMWGDVVLAHPDTVKEIPEDSILLNWNYEANVPEESSALIAASGLEQYVCPGVHGWNRLMNDMDSAGKNIRSMVRNGVKYQASGMLNTDWGDLGHINLFANSIPGMIYGAGLCWNTEDDDESRSDEYISKLEYGDSTGKIVCLLRELSQLPIIDWSAVALWYYFESGFEKGENDYDFEQCYKPIMLECSYDKVSEVYQRIVEIESEILEISARAYDERKTDFREFYISARGLALFQALLPVIKKCIWGQPVPRLIYEPSLLAEKLEYWFVEYAAAWRERNKESELYRIKEVIMGVCKIIRKAG